VLKALVVLLWPAGIAVILAVTALAAKRSGRSSPPATVTTNGHHDGDRLVAMRAAPSSIIGMLLILVVGAVAVYALTSVLGVLNVTIRVVAGPARTPGSETAPGLPAAMSGQPAQALP
jgi:hypothetical protein